MIHADDYKWYTPAVYDKNDNYKYTGKSHIVVRNATLCGRIKDVNNYHYGTDTYDSGRDGSLNDCGSCVKAAEKMATESDRQEAEVKTRKRNRRNRYFHTTRKWWLND